METLLLIGVLAFLAGMVLYGYKRGMIRLLISLVTTVVAFLISIILLEPCEMFIKNNTPVYDKIKEQMTEYTDKYVTSELDFSTREKQKETIEQLNLPKAIQDKLLEDNMTDEKLTMNVDTINDYIATSLTDITVSALAMFVLFVITKMILRIIISLLNVISRLPIIHEMNKLLGSAVGLVEGIFVIWVLCLFVTFMSGTHTGEMIMSAISSNSILSFIYNSNIIMKFL